MITSKHREIKVRFELISVFFLNVNSYNYQTFLIEIIDILVSHQIKLLIGIDPLVQESLKHQTWEALIDHVVLMSKRKTKYNDQTTNL